MKPTPAQTIDHTAAIAYLEKHWQEMGLEYVDGGVPARLSQEHDVSGSWDVEYARVGKWRTLPDTRSDFEALAISEKTLRDRLEKNLGPCSLAWSTIDGGELTIDTADAWSTSGELIAAGWSEHYHAPTAIEALHKACRR